MNATVDGVKIIHTAFVVHLTGEREHHIRQVGADRIQPVGQIGEHTLHMNGSQCLCRTIDQFGGTCGVDVVTDLRCIQRRQRRGGTLCDFGCVFDAVASSVQFLTFPRLWVDAIDAFDGLTKIIGLLPH